MLPDALIPSTLLPHCDPLVAEQILALVRQFGWEEGLPQLRQRIAAAQPGKPRALLQLYLAWLAAERGDHATAHHHFQEAETDFPAWSLAGRAFVALGQSLYIDTHAFLDRAGQLAPADDPILRAAIAHCRGAVLTRQGDFARALPHLYAALNGFGIDHFGAGRVFDTLGTVYAHYHGDFFAAELFYKGSLRLKARHGDKPGQALTEGQLGRLSLDWDDLDRADEHYRKDQDLCHQIDHTFGHAIVYCDRGDILLRRGKPEEALQLLRISIDLCEKGHWSSTEAAARVHAARAHLVLGQVAEAQAEVGKAAKLYHALSHHDGIAESKRALALVQAAQGNHDDAESLFARAIAHYDQTGKPARAARCWLELARVRKRPGQPPLLVVEALTAALVRAERSRRHRLLAEIEGELKKVNEADLYRRHYLRARGHGVPDDLALSSLGMGETATMMFLDLEGFSAYALREDANVVLHVLNQTFATVGRALEQYDIVVNQYLGDGFMAFARGPDHALRAVAGGLLVLQELRALNAARRLLEKPVLEARIGVATGEVRFGNVGTHRKVDFTAVGSATNLAARLQSEAEAGQAVCVAEATYRLIEDLVLVRDKQGRPIKPKNMGEAQVWDATGLREG